MIRLCIALLCSLSLEQSIAQADVTDSLETRLRLHPESDSSRVNLLNALSYQYQWLDFNRSLHYAEEAQKVAESISFQQGIATACFRQAHCYWALGDSERAVEKALSAVSIAEKQGLTNVLAETYRILAISYRDQQEIEKAVSYIRKAETLAALNKNWDLLARVYNLAGVIAYTRGLNDSALVYYQKSLQVSDEYPVSRFHISHALSNIGAVYLDENPDKGLVYFAQALTSARETRNKSAEAGILSDIGKAYLLKNNYKEAERHLNRSLELSLKLGLKRVSRHVYYSLTDLKLREGKTAEAFNYMKAYYDVRDSLLNGSKTRQIVELETRFEREKQEQKIKLLEQEQRIQRLWTIVLIVGSTLLVAALITIYRLEKLRSAKARQLLESQQALNENLRETDLLKSRFYANISHEFRTPLSLILGPLEEQLRSSKVSPAEKKNLMMTQRNANRLLNLVNQLLELSKLEAGKMQLNIRQGDLGVFLNLLTSSFDSLAEHKQIKFLRSISGFEKHFGYDEDKVEKIVTNILFNAFKFTPPGGQVGISIHEWTESGEIVISVADTGKGIPKDEQAAVFSPFYQLKNSGDDDQPGTGLGLSLVNELVCFYGGRITLASELDQGTCITVILPVFKPTITTDEQPSTIIHQFDTKSMPLVHEPQSAPIFPDESDTILVVEDNSELRNFIASGFRKRFVVLTAVDGEEGLAMAMEHLPDVIISDVMMPKMNGLELTSSIRQDERSSHIPVILLTARADDRSRIAGLKDGADVYLAKPFSMEELQIRVNNLLAYRRRLANKLKEELTLIKEHATEPAELSLDEKFIQKVKSTIEENLSNSSFSVEMLAEQMSLSRAQLFRKLKALINSSPSECINDLRLQRAANLIRSRADTVSQIGYAVGFNEQSYFSKRFRKKYGVSPSEYAQM